MAAFPGGNAYGDFASFEYDSGIQKFVGDVVSHEFRGVAVPERQRWVWDRLREVFGDESQEVSLVLTYSPEEWAEVGERAAG
ncbi:MAG TPA: hypothetical protein VMI31_00675 [Fimbriimonadaceae bacterium]|nr:hypothetical protein [Fimbriimonadaceae bacterium]